MMGFTKSAGKADAIFTFDNSYVRLPARFFARVAPLPVKAPKLIALNAALAGDLGLDSARLASPDGVAFLSGNALPQGSAPIATAYAGHQFGQFVPQLGDGRAVLLGEVVGRDGIRYDIQLKGSGRTPFSRSGDGRAALGPVLREYLVSEAMAALGIPTTRSLAAVTTGETVARETMLPGAILTRVAASHIRIGTFQYLAAWGDHDGLRALADYAIARHYPAAADAPNPYAALFEAVIARQADLMARWLLVGFIHGVMNTDNMAISGETIDYGPCAFLDAYDPAKVFSSIDVRGRYAFGNQPRIAHWNLSRLAETLLPFLAENEDRAIAVARAALDGFALKFGEAYTAGLCRKIGLSEVRAGDDDLAKDLLARMAANEADFPRTFRWLCDETSEPRVRTLFRDPAAFDEWATRWHQRLSHEDGDAARALMRANNPGVIPRNHRIEEVIAAAVDHGDFAPFHTLHTVLSNPYGDQTGFESYSDPPRSDQLVERTFCGT